MEGEKLDTISVCTTKVLYAANMTIRVPSFFVRVCLANLFHGSDIS